MNSNKQHGFNLIELMIAMTIGTLIIAAIVNIFIQSAGSSKQVNVVSDIQQTGRTALDIIREDIVKAGIDITPPLSTDTVFVLPGEPGTPNLGIATVESNTLAKTAPLTTLLSPSDRISIAYRFTNITITRAPDTANMYDTLVKLRTTCAGNQGGINSSGFVVNTYSVGVAPGTTNGPPTLLCTGSVYSDNNALLSTMVIALVTNVVSFQVQLGKQDSPSTLTNAPIAYQTPTSYILPGLGAGRIIASVRLGLVIRTDTPTSTAALARNIPVLNQRILLSDITALNQSASSSYMYRTFVTTVAIPNVVAGR